VAGKLAKHLGLHDDSISLTEWLGMGIDLLGLLREAQRPRNSSKNEREKSKWIIIEDLYYLAWDVPLVSQRR
jgi:hypothetical protein